MDDSKKILKMLEEQDKRIIRIENLLENLIPKTTETEYPKQKPEITKSKSNKSTSGDYKGLSGGIQFVIDSGYLGKLRSMREIFEELKKEGYYYSLQSVDTTLRKMFVLKRKILDFLIGQDRR